MKVNSLSLRFSIDSTLLLPQAVSFPESLCGILKNVKKYSFER